MIDSSSESPHIQFLRSRLQETEERIQEAQEAIQTTHALVVTAQTARQERQAELATFQQQALEATEKTLTTGKGKVSAKERAADRQIARLQRELERADQIIAALIQGESNAQAQMARCQQDGEAARMALEQGLLGVEAEQLHQKVQQLVEQMTLLLAEGRTHNRRVVEMVKRGQGMMTSDTVARLKGSNLLFLPGGHFPVQDERKCGFALEFARDLTFAEG